MAYETTNSIKLRELQTADLFLVVNLLKKLTKSTLPDLMVSITELHKSSEEPTMEQVGKIGTLVLNELYESLEDDLIKWFASLVELTVDDFMLTPIDTILNIIDELTGPGYTVFFSKAYKLYKKMQGFRKGTPKK